jgi:Xaa-Pro aminopeptidase
MQKLTSQVLIIDAPERSADLYYGCRFWAPDPLVFFMRRKDRHLIVSNLEYGRAQKHAREQKEVGKLNVWTPDMLGVGKRKRNQMSDWALALLGHLNVRQIIVPPTFPHGIAERLRRSGVSIRICKGPLFPKREIKTKDELSKIIETQKAATEAMKVAINLIRKCQVSHGGYLMLKKKQRLRSEHVQRAIQDVLLDHRTLCKDVIVAGGLQATDPHERGHGPLRACETIAIDIFPQHLDHGYWGDLTRTVFKGKAPTAVKRMYGAVKAAHDAAIRAIAPRVGCSTVHERAAETLRKRGFRTEIRGDTAVGFIHSTGHGLGLDIHEAPSLGPRAGRLRSGNVVTIEPGLYYPELGGIRVEDTVVVTAKGARTLVACPHLFEV